MPEQLALLAQHPDVEVTDQDDDPAAAVSPAQITRWQQGQPSDLRSAERVDVLELVLSELSRPYEPDVARRWIEGLNPHLGDRRPIDVVRSGRAEDLLPALRAEIAGSPS